MGKLAPQSSRPLYAQLSDEIRRQIQSGELKPNERLLPELEFALEYDVSRGTVRQALDRLVRDGLVQRTQGKGTFVRATRNDTRSRTIGFVVPYLRDGLVNEIIRGAERALHERDYSMILGHSNNDLETEVTQVTRLRERNAEGMILFPVAKVDEARRLGESLLGDLPTVLVDRTYSGYTGHRVVADNRSGAYAVVRHLLDLGHERIACITSPDRPSSVGDRIAGYEAAMLDAGHFPLAAIPLRGSGRVEAGRSAGTSAVPAYSAEDLGSVELLIAGDSPPTALFCINDFIAIGVLNYLYERKIRVPEEMAVAGFDDIALSSVASISLTTAAQPMYEIGRQAAQRLLALLDGTQFDEPELIVPTVLKIRRSTAGRGQGDEKGALPGEGGRFDG